MAILAPPIVCISESMRATSFSRARRPRGRKWYRPEANWRIKPACSINCTCVCVCVWQGGRVHVVCVCMCIHQSYAKSDPLHIPLIPGLISCTGVTKIWGLLTCKKCSQLIYVNKMLVYGKLRKFLDHEYGVHVHQYTVHNLSMMSYLQILNTGALPRSCVSCVRYHVTLWPFTVASCDGIVLEGRKREEVVT